MKRIVPFLLTVFLLPVLAVAQFEGTIDMKMMHDRDGVPMEMVYTMSVKNDLLAADVRSTGTSNEEGKFILRGDKQVLWVIDDSKQMYLEFSLKDDAPAPDRKSLMSKKKENSPKLRKTGKSQKVLGYLCEEWMMTEGDEVTSIWGTSKLGGIYDGLMKSFKKISRESENHMEGWESALAQMRIFPLKVVRSEAGKVKSSQEVTKIKTGSVPAATFEAPAGYSKQSLDDEMEKVMKQMQEGMSKQNVSIDSGGKDIDMQKMLEQLQQQMMKTQGEGADSSEVEK